MPSLNSIGGMNLTVIAEETLQTLLAYAPLLGSFTTNFSSEAIPSNGKGVYAVTTRLPLALTAVDVSSGYTRQATTSSAITMTLNTHIGVPYAFSDLEIAQNGLAGLQRNFIRPAVQAIVKKLMTDTFANFVTSSYGKGYVGAATAITYAKTVDFATSCSLNNIGEERFFIVNPTIYGALAKDTAISPAYAYGTSDVVQKYQIMNVAGLKVIQYNDLSSLTLASSRSDGTTLLGVGGQASSMCIIARVPEVSATYPGLVENATDPSSGLTIQIRRWTDPNNGLEYLAPNLLYGIAKGDTSAALLATPQ